MVSVYSEKKGKVWFGVAFEDEQIYATSFGSNENRVLRELKESFPPDASARALQFPERTPFAEQVIRVLENVFNGKDDSHMFDFNMKRLPNYTRKVIDAVCQIPAGYVASYGGVAKAVGGSPRAVGNVMARNPFAPLCPCHRVVTSDLRLGGYGGGLDVKLAFLRREQRGHKSKKMLEIDHGKMELIPVEYVFEKLKKDKR